MIDKLSINLVEYSKEARAKALHSLQCTKVISYPNDDRKRYICTLKNLEISIFDPCIHITGSLPKFLYGHNGKVLTKADTQLAIEELSSSIHLPVHEGIIQSQFEIGMNIPLSNPVPSYYPYLGEAPRLKSRIVKGELIYSNTLRAIALYDKKKELREKQNFICQGNNHLLRFEVRALRRPAKFFGMKVLKVSDLYSETFWNLCLDKIAAQYSSIQKIERCGNMHMNNKKNLEAFLFSCISQHGFLADVKSEINRAYRNREIDKVKKSRYLNKLNQWDNSTSVIESEDLISELNEGLMQQIANYR